MMMPLLTLWMEPKVQSKFAYICGNILRIVEETNCAWTCVIPAHVAQWSMHLGAIYSGAWYASAAGVQLEFGHVHLPPKNYLNNSYARDEQGDNPGRKKRARWCPL